MILPPDYFLLCKNLCHLPAKFVAGNIIYKKPPQSWEVFLQNLFLSEFVTQAKLKSPGCEGRIYIDK